MPYSNNINPSLMEPMMPEDRLHRLENMAFDLYGKSQALATMLNVGICKSVGDLMYPVHCYYSELIDGHHIYPANIRWAISNDLSDEPEIRDLQLEARAFTDVMRLIDDAEALSRPLSRQFVLWVHAEFCKRLPEQLLNRTNTSTGENTLVAMGRFRDGDAQAGLRGSVPAVMLEQLMDRFEEVYASVPSRAGQVMAVAAAHHRMLWMQPFYNGNGHIARLQSYACLRRLGIGSGPWSLSRGLGRNVQQYYLRLQDADLPRRDGLDGRGNLSLKGLEAFCEFFLMACINEVDDMCRVFEPEALLRRIGLYCRDEVAAGRLMKGSFNVLREALMCGAVERGRAPEITGYADRQARKVLKGLLDHGLLTSDSPKGAVRLAFPGHVLECWLPGLYPAA